jgi:3-oxoacyl-[acyl-carrier protein] reductase
MQGNELQGKIALVTGASGGIGAAIAAELAAHAATIALAYGRNAGPAQALAAEIVDRGGRAIAIAADLKQASAPGQLVDTVEATLGAVDVLVANAGTGAVASYEDVDAGIFDEALAVNLRAPYLLARRALPGMLVRRFGRIIFMSSVAAFTGGIVGPHYAASKAVCTA